MRDNASSRRRQRPAAPLRDKAGSQEKKSPGLEDGFGPRRAALKLLEALHRKGTLFDALTDPVRGDEAYLALTPRDRALCRAIVLSSLRHQRAIDAALDAALDHPLAESAWKTRLILVLGAAQIFYLDVPAHAAVATAVSLTGAARDTRGFRGLVNAVLRKLTRLEAPPEAPHVPDWLETRWRKAYGDSRFAEIDRSLGAPAPLDLTATGDAAALAERLGGEVLSTGTVRLAGGDVTALDGFDAGAFFVQDAAAALPARLLGTVRGLRVADLCAAPGGKTAQLCLAGAAVTAVDLNRSRLKRLEANLARLGLAATIIASPAEQLKVEPFDAILLDAPCSSTGTLRRHPDVGFLKSAADITALAGVQARLVDAAVALLKPGGLLVYSTCSLEPEEGEDQARQALQRHAGLVTVEVLADEVPGLEGAITPEGWLRTLPSMLAGKDARLSGLDGFFAARFRKAG
ncbi:MAG: RsmB/NOP family class I SAM-dependent RNA methyltransferase [Hyphomicrobiaceae bacterium]|nr:RsmB/NOP family class I SAM-dependent RNA methyltransferase [Hyphomicrobiaceae bacterium]